MMKNFFGEGIIMNDKDRMSGREKLVVELMVMEFLI